MADLPRYQNMGVQYADLPKISTAAQQVQSQGFSQLSQNLDRMLSYAEDAATTEAKKQAIKYAVDNPITQEQLKTAVSDPSTLKVKGAGRVFQDTYQATVAAQLSTDLQLDADASLKSIENKFQLGQMSAAQARQEMMAIMDGQSALMVAVSPEYSVRHRASLATAASTSFKKIQDIEMKTLMGVEKARYDVALNSLPAQLEDLFKYNAGAIDPTTGQAVDMNLMIADKLKPFAESVRKLGGDNSYFQKALEVVDKAKIGSLQALATDPTYATSPGIAAKRFMAKDFGALTPVFNSLSTEQKTTVLKSTIGTFAEIQQARNLDKQAQDLAEAQRVKALNLELLTNPTDERRKQITVALVSNGVPITTAQTLVSPQEGPENAVLYGQLIDQANRGIIQSVGDVAQYSSKLSRTQFSGLIAHVNSEQGKKATERIRLEAGIRQNAFITEDQKAKEKKLLGFYTDKLTEKTKNADGTEVFLSPVQAADAAIEAFNQDKAIQNSVKSQAQQQEAVRKVFEAKKMTMPNLPLESIDFDKISGLGTGERDRLKKIQADYKKSIQEMSR